MKARIHTRTNHYYNILGEREKEVSNIEKPIVLLRHLFKNCDVEVEIKSVKPVATREPEREKQSK